MRGVDYRSKTEQKVGEVTPAAQAWDSVGREDHVGYSAHTLGHVLVCILQQQPL